MKKKILYFIYSSGKTSGGGHFYSLRSVSGGLANNIDYQILNIGAVFANPLKNLPHTNFIRVSKANLLFKLPQIYRFVKRFNPDVIHAFDASSLFVARTIALLLKIKLVFTKCGGRNGSHFIPDADCQILFSLENLDHFTKWGNPKVPKYYLPNRVDEARIDNEHVLAFKKKYDVSDRFIIMRIARFNRYYDLSFKQSIELLRRIILIEKSAILVLVGQPQDTNYLEELKTSIEDRLPVLFVTEEQYTLEASRLISMANIMVSTGRGVMEACSLNKVVFCPTKNTRIPTLLNAHTFKDLFKMNFSERAEGEPEKDAHLNISKIIEENNTKELFDLYFSVKTVVPTYSEIYSNSDRVKFNFRNYWGHCLRFFKPRKL